MSYIAKVIWSEGMLLQPQHFQQHDRYFENLIIQRANTLAANNWGISELKIDENLLKLGKFGIAACRGILPDGTAFDIPNHDKPPMPIDIPEGTTNCKIYLALPLYRPGIPETTDKKNNLDSIRYHSEPIEVHDNNANSELSTTLQTGKLALRLMLEKQECQGYTCLSLAQILEARSDNKIILNEQFISPCLDIQTINLLHNFTKEVHSLLSYRGSTLIRRLADTGTGGVAEVADFMLLQIINRTEPLFLHLQQQINLHPESLYRLFIQLIGELATFTHRERRPPPLEPYNHDELQKTFTPIFTELRRSLSAVLEESAVAIKLEQRQANLWAAAITDKTLLKKSTFVLAVHANLPQEAIRSRFPAQMKIAPVEEIRNLVNRALPGIELRALPVAPRQIPYHTQYVYFALNRESNLWQYLEKSAAIAFHAGGDFPGLKLELWAIKDK